MLVEATAGKLSCLFFSSHKGKSFQLFDITSQHFPATLDATIAWCHLCPCCIVIYIGGADKHQLMFMPLLVHLMSAGAANRSVHRPGLQRSLPGVPESQRHQPGGPESEGVQWHHQHTGDVQRRPHSLLQLWKLQRGRSVLLQLQHFACRRVSLSVSATQNQDFVCIKCVCGTNCSRAAGPWEKHSCMRYVWTS